MKAFIRATALAGLILASVAASAAAQTAAPAAAERMFDATTLALSADGVTKVVPNEATITLGVTTTAPDAAAAMRQNAQQMSAVMQALRAAGLADKDIQTSNIALNAQYVYAQNQPPKLTGYDAANTVMITVDDLTRLGPIIDAVTAAGANQVNGIAFGLSDPTAAENEARLAAVRALTAKAELYAGATGYHLARLVSLSEGSAYQPAPMQPMMAGARLQAVPVAISAGELTVRVTVNAIYEMTR